MSLWNCGNRSSLLGGFGLFNQYTVLTKQNEPYSVFVQVTLIGERRQMLEKAKTAALRDLADLAEAAGVTPQAIYQAARRGWVPAIPFGRRLKMTEAAYDYHVRFGYGPTVPCYGTADAVAFERQRASAVA